MKGNLENETTPAPDVCAVALMILRPDDKDVVSFFKCALNVRLLSRMTQRRNRVRSSPNFLWPMKRAGCQLKLPDQVEKGHTSVLLAFRTPVQHRVN